MNVQKRTILIVDDEEVILNLLHSVLSKHGFDTILASNGQQALDLVKNKIPDLILLDIEMPIMDGYTLCKMLKELDSTKSVGIFMMTGCQREQGRERLVEYGVDDFLGKPLDMQEVIFRVKTWLQLKQSVSAPERFIKYSYKVNNYLKRREGNKNG